MNDQDHQHANWQRLETTDKQPQQYGKHRQCTDDGRLLLGIQDAILNRPHRARPAACKDHLRHGYQIFARRNGPVLPGILPEVCTAPHRRVKGGRSASSFLAKPRLVVAGITHTCSISQRVARDPHANSSPATTGRGFAKIAWLDFNNASSNNGALLARFLAQGKSAGVQRRVCGAGEVDDIVVVCLGKQPSEFEDLLLAIELRAGRPGKSNRKETHPRLAEHS